MDTPLPAAKVTATPMAIAAMQMRCVRLMTRDPPFQPADAQMDSVCLLPAKPVYAPVSSRLSLLMKRRSSLYWFASLRPRHGGFAEDNEERVASLRKQLLDAD
jgi:hypothetical protein